MSRAERLLSLIQLLRGHRRPVSGHALADQLALLARLGMQGAGLYRYGSLFANFDAPALAESEAEAIKGVWQG